MANNSEELKEELIDDLVKEVLEKLPKKVKNELKKLKENDLILTHFGLGIYIRNNFDLWHRTVYKKESKFPMHPDDVSSEVIKRIWKKLKK